MRKDIRLVSLAVLTNVCFFTYNYSQPKSEILSLLPLPNELGKWQQSDTAKVFVGEQLYELINGGADIYFEYGFQQVVSAKYESNQMPPMKLEIYEMNDASAAYGIYSINVGAQGKKIDIGNDCLLFEYYLMFWKNRYLVYITAEDTSSTILSGIFSIATSVDRKLGEKGKKPKMLDLLPKDELLTTKYIKGFLGLTSVYVFDTKNVFKLTECVVGNYSSHRLIILPYNSTKETDERYRSLQEVLRTSRRFSNYKVINKRSVLNDQNGNQICISQYSNLIIAIIAEPKNDALTIFENVISLLKK